MSDPAPSYAAGDRVRIRDLGKPGHVRTPTYVRDKVGVIERYCGAFENPEERAYGRWGLPPVPLYRVRFRQDDLWPDYDGAPGDVLELEIYDHWLAPANEAKP
jgi:nitrile hydratase